MVADDVNGVLFIGEEEFGIWKVDLKPEAKPILIHESRKENNPLIEYDIEGLAIYQDGDDPKAGFLIASIQGNFSYAVFERSGENKYITSFKIVDSESIDGVEETDGIEIYSKAIGSSFPRGILIVQDGFNYDVGVLKSQNYKYVDLNEVLSLLEKQMK